MMNLFNKLSVCYGSKSPCAWGGMNFTSVAPSRAVVGRRKNLLCSGFSGCLGLIGLSAVERHGWEVLILHLLESEGSPTGFMKQMH